MWCLGRELNSASITLLKGSTVVDTVLTPLNHDQDQVKRNLWWSKSTDLEVIFNIRIISNLVEEKKGINGLK
jgi:hypothetical protein